MKRLLKGLLLVVLPIFALGAFVSQSALGRYTTAALPTCDSSLEDLVVYDVTTASFKECNSSAWTAIGGGAPTDAEYIVGAANGTLSAERVCTDTETIDCDMGTAAQAKLNVLGIANRGTILEWYEEFLSGTNTGGATGSQGLSGSATGGSITGVDGSASHPGVVRMSTGATDNMFGQLYTMYAEGFAIATAAQSFYSGDWLIDILYQPGANGTAITDVGLFVGLRSTALAVDDAAAGIWIRYDTDRSDSTYIFQLCDAAGANGCDAAGDATDSETVASTIAPSAGVWNRFRIRRATSGVGGNPTIYMRVNDETEKTFCSSGCDDTAGDMPTGDVILHTTVYTRTTAVRASDVDYIYVRWAGLSRY